MIDTDWQEEERQGPLGPDVLAWFGARLELEFQTICDGCGRWRAKENFYTEWKPYRDEMVQWFVDRAEDFVDWIPAKCYLGEGWSSGEWVLQRGRVYHRLDEARGAAMYPDLDSWLRADLEGTVPRSPREPSAWGYVRGKARERYETHTQQVSRHWPIVCRDCGQEFRADRHNVVRCRECRDQAKTVRKARNAQA